MGRQAATVLYVFTMAIVVVGVDVLFFRNHFWERLAEYEVAISELTLTEIQYVVAAKRAGIGPEDLDRLVALPDEGFGDQFN